MASFRITWATSERTVICCICKVEFVAPKGAVLQRRRKRRGDRKRRVEAICPMCGVEKAPELAALLPAPPRIDATCARWLARTVLDEGWAGVARRLSAKRRDPESDETYKALTEPLELRALVTAWPVAFVQEVVVRERPLHEVRLRAQLGAASKLCRAGARQAPHLLDAAALLAELDQALADTETGKAELGVRRIAVLAAPLQANLGKLVEQQIDVAVEKQPAGAPRGRAARGGRASKGALEGGKTRPMIAWEVLSEAARLLRGTFGALFGEFAKVPTREDLTRKSSVEEAERSAREPLRFAEPVWAPLIALVVHVTIPWWLPAPLLPRATERLQLLFGDALLQHKVRDFVELKAVHLAGARKYRDDPTLRARDGATWEERLEWAGNCASKVIDALVKESLWVLGVHWESMEELLVETRAGGGRRAKKVKKPSEEVGDSGGAVSSDEDTDDGVGSDDGDEEDGGYNRKEMRFGHGSIRRSVKKRLEEQGDNDGPPSTWQPVRK
ncbi:MAG: hypothetical protein U0324_27240 [Polyangiales bacterium]